MRCAIILNRNGGTLRTTDCEALGARLATLMETAGHKTRLWIGRSKDMVSRLEASAADKDIDCIIIGGGDGSVSLAASLCFKHGKTLGVLPAGTMNFFARSLGMPLDLDAASQALAGATVRKVDCGTVNGQVFVHQVSLGIQPRIVEYRNALSYGSRIGKMIASLRAGLKALLRPPSFRARISAADLEDDDRFSIIAVSNNAYQEGQLPFAGKIDDGVLAVYTAPKLSFWRNLALARDLVLGRWTNNEHFLSQSIGRVQIDIRSRVRGRNMSIDGELKPLPRRLDIQLHPLSLKVLAPPK